MYEATYFFFFWGVGGGHSGRRSAGKTIHYFSDSACNTWLFSHARQIVKFLYYNSPMSGALYNSDENTASEMLLS